MSLQTGESEPLTAAIIGAGVVGGYHIKAQQELGSNIVVYDPNKACTDRVVGQYGGLVVARTFEEAMELADVVHICTPPMLHMEGALASIEHGKPTIVEKPITHDLGEAVEIYKAADAADVPVLAGKHFRLTPPFMEINAGMRRGDIGDINSIESTYVHDMRKLKDGVGWRRTLGRNGFVYEGAAHPVDLNIWLANQPVTSVQAIISTRKICPEYGWGEDHAYSLVYEDGVVGRVWSSACSPTPKHGTNLAIHGSDGAYRAHNKYPSLDTFRSGDADWTTTETAPIGQTIRPMAELFHAFIRGEADNFDPMPNIKQALGVMIVLDTLEKAADSGRTERVPTVEEVLAR